MSTHILKKIPATGKKAYHKNWYEQNKESVLKRNSEYDKAHVDKRRARYKRWYDKHKLQCRIDYAMNRDERKRRVRKCYYDRKNRVMSGDTTKSKESIEASRSVTDWFLHRGEKHG